MTTTGDTMDELIQFLLARIADEEELAALITADTETFNSEPRCLYEIRRKDGNITTITRYTVYDAQKQLRECDAKLQMINAILDQPMSRVRPEDLYFLRLLAFPYTDHPDYHEEWKP